MAAGPPGRPPPRVRAGPGGPAAGWLACIRAISAGSLVQRKCSAGEASAWNDTREDGPAASSPSPRRADSSSCRSPADSRNSSATLPMAWGAWRSRIWVAELAITARPRSVDSTSSASWVTAASPAHALRADFASRNRNFAPSGSRISSHASSTVISRRLRRAGSETARQVVSRASRVAAGRSSSGTSRRLKTTRCPSGRVVVGAANRPAWVPSVNGTSRSASAVAAWRLRGAQRGREGGQQRRGPRPGPGVGGDPGPLVGGHDRLVQRRPLGRGRLAAAQHRDDGVDEQGTAGQGVRPGPPGGGQVERVQVHARRAQVDVRAADRAGEPGVLVLGVDHPALGPLVQSCGGSPAWRGRTCRRRRRRG